MGVRTLLLIVFQGVSYLHLKLKFLASGLSNIFLSGNLMTYPASFAMVLGVKPI